MIDYAIRFHIVTPIDVGLTTLAPAEPEYTLFDREALNTTVGLSVSDAPPETAFDFSVVILNAPEPVKRVSVELSSLMPFSLPVMFGREPSILIPN